MRFTAPFEMPITHGNSTNRQAASASIINMNTVIFNSPADLSLLMCLVRVFDKPLHALVFFLTEVFGYKIFIVHFVIPIEGIFDIRTPALLHNFAAVVVIKIIIINRKKSGDLAVKAVI